MGSIDTYRSLVARRWADLPAKTIENPWRTLPLEALRQANSALDATFYDVGLIDEAEAAALAPWLAHEGAILVVPPSGAGALSIYPDLATFRRHSDGHRVSTIAIAGVGSSALGGAALARGVANARGTPVLAIVSGYGFADVVTQALGGWFFFGALNSIRHAFDILDRATRSDLTPIERLLELVNGVGIVRLTPDTSTLVELLTDPAFAIDTLVGHSKGNLVISEALYWLLERDPARAISLGSKLQIITLCAKVAMPKPCKSVFDVTGEWDLLGFINSRIDIPSDLNVPHAWHSTNPEVSDWLAIDVESAVNAALGSRKGGPVTAAPLSPSEPADMIQRWVTRVAVPQPV